MPFLFALLLLASPALANSESDSDAIEMRSAEPMLMQSDQTALSSSSQITETTKTTASAVNRRPAILHEPIIDEESSAIARDEAAVLSQVLDSTGSDD